MAFCTFFYEEKAVFQSFLGKIKIRTKSGRKIRTKIRTKLGRNQEEKLDGYYGLETVSPILHFLTFIHYVQVHNCFQDMMMVLPAWVDQYPGLLSRPLQWSLQARTEVRFWHLRAHLQGLFRFL